MPITFITGPVRSGKSSWAEHLAIQSAVHPVYVATAERFPDDDEWERRLRLHRERRADRFTLIETGLSGAPSLEEVVTAARQENALVVDSLGTWLAHRFSLQIARSGELDVDALKLEAARLVSALGLARARLYVIGEEVGWSTVSSERSARIFSDVLGRLNRRVASLAEQAYLVVCGYAVDLRTIGRNVEE
ncbi:MAG TPA: bifunctional adenosylcobinamide kinase/adenosylcobinamide-phosphate guanylyltransferase [Candidatus Baltobacteraceae bacterium]|nr:bifunctional adenosylcobinamide kinase/adenosylcobinamide-phosphate guanylyltransferase [Candidatus Baltobacteraceae bacterium]